MSKYIIGIDQSTQGTKALLVDEGGHLIHRADRSHRQIVNEAGWVSHDPAEIAANVLAVARTVVEETGVDPADIAGVGISNQRETTVAWSRTTGEPLCDAVVWQCARARELCDELAAREGVAELVRDTTGLVLSPYYPAGKMAWILANVPAAAEAAAAGELCLGTIDAWVVWTLTGGAEFRCDWSNASRTQLFDLRRGCWSEPVCEAFGVNPACLPQVTDSDGLFGTTDLGGFLPAPVPIHGVLGDSHAALFAQGCHSRGMAKATYGTGSSVMMNVGDEFVASSHGLSSSLAWRMDGVTEYVLEGNVSYAGRRQDVAARRPGAHQQSRGSHRPVLRRQSGEPRLLCAGVHWPGRAALGERCRGLRLWHDAHHGPCGVRKGRRRVDRLSDLRRDRCDGRGFGRGTGRASC